MNYNDAISYLTNEADLLSGDDKTKLEDGLYILENGTQGEKEEAVTSLNDLYWDAAVSSQFDFGEATFVVSYTVNPSRPSPFIRHA